MSPTGDAPADHRDPTGGSLGRWTSGRAKWLAGAVAGALVAAIAGTVYVTVIRPDVETVISGRSRLSIQTLGVGQFQPAGMVHSGAVLVQRGSATADQVPEDARSPEGYRRYLAWALEQDGVPLDTLALQVTVRAKTDEPVQINGIEAEVIERESPDDGWYRFPDIACGIVPVRTFDVDLDTDDTPVMLSPEDGSAPRPATDVYEVTASDPEVFQIRARTTESAVVVRLSLRWQSEAGSGSAPIGDFRVTAVDDRQQAYTLEDWSDPSRPLAPMEHTGGLGC